MSEPVTAGGESSESDPQQGLNADGIARVVAAFAARETATVDEVMSLAVRMVQAFGTLEVSSAPTPRRAPATLTSADPGARPALQVDKSVTDDTVFCLCCGRGFTMLKRHLKAEHGLTEEEYRARFDLPEDFPLVAPNYSERKAAYAKRVGLGKYRRDPASAEG